MDVGTGLLEAAGEVDIKAVITILDQNPNIYERDSENRTALHVALEAGSSKVVELLLEAGLDPNKANKASLKGKLSIRSSVTDTVVLCLAAWMVKTIISFVESGLKYIIPAGYILELVSWLIWTSLLGLFGLITWNVIILGLYLLDGPSLASAAVSFKGNTENNISMLLEAGYKPDDIEKELLWTHTAIQGYTTVYERLLSTGFPVDYLLLVTESAQLLTALQFACRYSRPETFSLLLRQGANPTLKDELGRSTLLFACESCK